MSEAGKSPQSIYGSASDIASSEFMNLVRARTPARILVGSAGAAYRTDTQLQLFQDHAAAVDAVHAELEPARDFGREFCDRWNLFTVSTVAHSKAEYLLRPDLGRRLSADMRELIARDCVPGCDLQVVIGDGLSAQATKVQVPPLLPLLAQGAKDQGWTFGQVLVIAYCRVGVMNDIGDLIKPAVLVLLIGERPGLATSESLSAYMAYQPKGGQTDANRNLISNVHGRGVTTGEAARRILALAHKMRERQISGVRLKEELDRFGDNSLSVVSPSRLP